jgi:hypothetical protein
MLWLNEKEVFQALDRFAKSPHVAERSRFAGLATRAIRMVRCGWGGLEVEEGLLDGPSGLEGVKPSSITVVDLEGTTTTLRTWPVLDGVHVDTLRTLAEFREFVFTHKPLQPILRK